MITLQATSQKLSEKYSSSKGFFHSKIIDEFIRENRSHSTTNYQDIQFLVDDEEYMKRFYQREEFRNKMFTFKEYYFYHQDCPRIFIEDLEIIYAKWQDRKRNIVYKKLKHLFNEGTSHATLSDSQEDVQGVTHFLFELSQYNPYSKKYYLRTQVKKDKESLKKVRVMFQTRDQISYLKHDLSSMLKQMNQLSAISTLDSTRVEAKAKIYHKKSQTQAEPSSYDHSSNSNSGLKINFKKKVEPHIVNRQEKAKYYQLLTAEKALNQKQTQFTSNNRNRTNSPKLNPVQNKQNSYKRLKINSIFAFTSLGQLGQQNNKVRANSKRQGCKLNLQFKSEQIKKIEGEKEEQQRKTLKTNQKSEKKKNITIRCASIGKLQPVKLEAIEAIEGKHHQISLTKLKTKQDEFCDRKLTGLTKNIESKLPSYKSEHTSTKKPFVKLKTSEGMVNMGNKKKLQIKL